MHPQLAIVLPLLPFIFSLKLDSFNIFFSNHRLDNIWSHHIWHQSRLGRCYSFHISQLHLNSCLLNLRGSIAITSLTDWSCYGFVVSIYCFSHYYLMTDFLKHRLQGSLTHVLFSKFHFPKFALNKICKQTNGSVSKKKPLDYMADLKQTQKMCLFTAEIQ